MKLVSVYMSFAVIPPAISSTVISWSVWFFNTDSAMPNKIYSLYVKLSSYVIHLINITFCNFATP